MKRQRGRNRGGGGKPQQNANRAFDSNGPEGIKVRGNAQHVFEKYQQLARDATSSGDRVLAENYLQHAEHYFRLLRAMQPQRPASEILGRDQFSSGLDIDFEDETIQAQAEAADEAAAEAAENGGEEGRDRSGWQGRDDRPRDGRDRDRSERQDGRREGRRDRWRDRDDRDRGERDRAEPRQERAERDPATAVEPQGAPPASSDERPSPVLRDSEGGESQAPAFLQTSTAREGADEAPPPARRPRRRRTPRSFEGGDNAPSNEAEEA